MGWLIVDGHEDIATELLETGRDFALPAPPGHALSLPDLKRGGVGACSRRSSPPTGYWKGETGTDNAERQIALYEALLARPPRGPLPAREPRRPVALHARAARSGSST